ncbi:MAG: beta strand repeat-containing protein [Nostoc sp. CmiVER01]|uniref:beta strand repeat-containing protein n=1 Tax=Nostoc sp. CmiVER01 TaxID=3075384 RepID=UPI002AD1E071|nr:calcium-binding protein [Nostoc sp. CmiVER01]MDZ8126913.1 calcium-binding protein [Nostoc sp. CmiVER01]
MANIIGTNKNDTLVGSSNADTIRGLAGNDIIIANEGNDTIIGNEGNDTLTGGGGKDKFIYKSYFNGTNIITDFGGVGKGTNPTAAVIAEVDTLKFQNNDSFTARNLLLTQNGSNLEISFEKINSKLILQNFKLENLQNLKATGARPAVGNILFNGETSITDSFHIFDANSTDTSLSIKNTVTFLNDLDNNITGLDDSDDVINGQGGNDKIDGLSGNDILRGGTGNDTLIGGVGNDTLIGDAGDNSLVGGTGDDNLNVNNSQGNNLLSGGDGNDNLLASGYYFVMRGSIIPGLDSPIIGNNTLNGGAGDDNLSADSSTGNNTLNGGAGDDSLSADYSIGNNLLSGGAGNDSLKIGISITDPYTDPSSLVTQTVDGGIGDDSLSGNYYNATAGITSTFNTTTNIGSITTPTNLVSYKNIEQLNITGTQYDDLIVGSNGNDTLSTGNGGNDTIDGGKGDDLLFGLDYTYATAITSTFNAITNTGLITVGTNRLSYKNIERLDISGTEYDDLIVGSNGNDTLNGGSYGGNDTIDGGKGDDLVSVHYYNPTQGITSTFNATTNTGLITDSTNRVSYKNIEQLDISDTEYDDNIVGSNGNDTLSTGSGNDTIDGGKGDDLLSVNDGSATQGITTSFNAITNTGLITDGTNRISYKNIERLNISGTQYDDLIVGSNGNDTLNGVNSGNDTIDGGKGDDLLLLYYSSTKGITTTFNATSNIGSITSSTNRVSYKNIERLDISGTNYDDLIVGNNGNDTLSGEGGNDTIIGGAGNDTLIASSYSGNSILYGGEGNDSLSFNNYTFIFETASSTTTSIFGFNSYNEGIDSIDGFNTTNQLIQVSAVGFGGGLSSGSLKANQFTIGTSATTNTQRFIYNSATGGLFFDQDGSACGFTQVKFAQLSTGLSLTENNFVVV